MRLRTSNIQYTASDEIVILEDTKLVTRGGRPALQHSGNLILSNCFIQSDGDGVIGCCARTVCLIDVTIEIVSTIHSPRNHLDAFQGWGGDISTNYCWKERYDAKHLCANNLLSNVRIMSESPFCHGVTYFDGKGVVNSAFENISVELEHQNKFVINGILDRCYMDSTAKRLLTHNITKPVKR